MTNMYKKNKSTQILKIKVNRMCFDNVSVVVCAVHALEGAVQQHWSQRARSGGAEEERAERPMEQRWRAAVFSWAPLPWLKPALFSRTVTYGLCSRCFTALLNCQTDLRRCELSVFEIRVWWWALRLRPRVYLTCRILSSLDLFKEFTS